MTILPFRALYDSKQLLHVPLSVSVGVFDGIHRGHQLLIKNITSRQDTKSAVITFRENPKALLQGDRYLGDITTWKQKVDIFSSYEVDYVIEIAFSSSFSQLSGEEFLTILAQGCDLRHVVIGENFHCGRGGRYSSREVRLFFTTHGIDVDIIPSLLYDGIHTVSSTRIREQVLAGDFRTVNGLIHRAFSLDIADLPQYRRDDAMIILKDQITQPLPPPGIYRVRCILQKSSTQSIVDIEVGDHDISVPVIETIRELVFEV